MQETMMFEIIGLILLANGALWVGVVVIDKIAGL